MITFLSDRAPAVLAAGALLLVLGPAPAGRAATAPDPAAALETARKAAAAGKPEEVLFALDGLGDLTPPAAAEAAKLLGSAAAKAIYLRDPLLALQLCQMALRRSPDDADSLASCTTAAQASNQFDPAEKYVAALAKAHPSDPRAPLLAARLAIAQGEWERARASSRAVLDAKEADKGAKAEAGKMLARAEQELAERKAALSESEALTRRLDEAREQAMKLPADGRTARITVGSGPGGLTASGGVVMYKTSWCGVCKKAAAFLRRKKVTFEERDIEADPAAAVELSVKAAVHNVRPTGVPVLDVGGDLLLGFSEASLTDALKKHGFIR